MKALGEVIREIRKQRGLSLRSLAKEAGISAQYLSGIERRQRYPAEGVLTSIAEALGTTVKILIVHDERPPIDEILRRVVRDPAYGFAIKRLVNQNVRAEELEDFMDHRRGGL